MRLNFISPFIKAAILQGNQTKGLKLSALMREMPLLWEAQEKLFGFKKTISRLLKVIKAMF